MIAALLAAAALAGACPSDPRVAGVAEAWVGRQAVPALEIGDAAQALCFRKALMTELSPQLGPVVGYKVGVFSAAGRKAYGTDRPILGELHEKMLLPDGATLPAAYGVGANWESDFILVVKDEGINAARTPQEIYAHLRAYRPFIELPARNYGPEVKVSAHQLAAMDVAARWGVIGPETPLPQTPQGMAALIGLSATSTVTSAEGTRVDQGKIAQTLGDPLEIVAFARDAVLVSGGRMKAGDLISLGVITPARPPQPGETLRVDYQVFDGPPTSVSVTFN